MNMSSRKKNFRSLHRRILSGRRIECVNIVFKQNSDSVAYQNQSVLGYNHFVCFDNYAIYNILYCLMLYSHLCFMYSCSYNYKFNFIRKFFWKKGGMWHSQYSDYVPYDELLRRNMNILYLLKSHYYQRSILDNNILYSLFILFGQFDI